MSDSGKIMALEQKRCRAMIEADVATLSELFADDLLWIHATARPDTKSGFIESVATGKTQYQSIESTDQGVRFYGDTAIVSGIADIKARVAGEERVLQNRFTIVWARIGGAWKVVTWQSTPVRKPV